MASPSYCYNSGKRKAVTIIHLLTSFRSMLAGNGFWKLEPETNAGWLARERYFRDKKNIYKKIFSIVWIIIVGNRRTWTELF